MAAPVLAQPARRIPRRWLALAALLCIGAQLPGSLALTGLALGCWIALLAAGDRAALERLWMPRFWLVTLLFALGSGLLLGPREGPLVLGVLSLRGLQLGLLMVLRGLFVFALASWASRALGRDELERAAARLGARQLGLALSAALQLLPELTARLAAHRIRGRRARGFVDTAVALVAETAHLAETKHLAETETKHLAEPPARPRRSLVAIVGPPGSGKTTLLRTLLGSLRSRSLRVAGVTQPALVEQGRRVGYLLRDEGSGDEHPLARRQMPAPGSGCSFSFDETAWSWAERRVLAAGASADVLVIDELGRLEARGEGHLRTARQALASAHAGALLVAVRADVADAIASQLGAFDHVLAVPADAAAVAECIEQLVRACATTLPPTPGDLP